MKEYTKIETIYKRDENGTKKLIEGEFRNEGDALDAAREQAEDADMNEFVIGDEQQSTILEVH